jgi:glycosyltransferase involved in cell wall biosynthesis
MVAARLCRVPVRVYVIRGLRLETSSGLRRRVLYATDRIAMSCATHVVANSDSVLALARDIGVLPDGRGEVIGAGSGNGVDVDRFVPATVEERAAARSRFGITDDTVVIAFVGRLTNDKGVGDLVATFVDRFDGRNDVWLLLVGGFESGDRLDPTIRRTIDRHPRIVSVPWVAETRAAYHAADLVAFPSYREGLPNVPLEAQASGVPVVGYAATGTVDAVVDGQTGVLVPTGDTDALGRELVGLADAPERRRMLGSAARRDVVARFDRRRVVEGIADRYEDWCPSS